MKYLITGLGNIGSEYWGTRHNVGFRVVNHLVEQAGASFTDERYGAVARIRIKNCELVVLKPNTYMNLSGNAVRYWLQKENIPVENLLIVVDDLALPFGTLRFGQIDFVLGKFPQEELDQMPAILDRATEIIKSFCLAGIQLTMNQFNNK